MKVCDTRKWIIGLTALSLLSACAEETAPPQTAEAGPRHHVSPPAVPAPEVPPGTFDRDRAKTALDQAVAANQAHQTDEARHQAETAIDSWPADPAAWKALADICQAQGDQKCHQQATFFRAKVAYANTLPARAAVLGFQTISEQPEGGVASGITYDRRSLDEAKRLWSFYDTQDKEKSGRDAPAEMTFMEKYPYGPALLAGGIVAGAITMTKSLANQ